MEICPKCAPNPVGPQTEQTQVHFVCLGEIVWDKEAYTVTVPLDLFNLFFFQLALHLAASLILPQILR